MSQTAPSSNTTFTWSSRRPWLAKTGAFPSATCSRRVRSGLISAVEHYKEADGGFHSSLVEAISATMDDVLAQTEEAQRNDEAFVTACRLLEAAQRLLSERLERKATPAELASLLQWEEAPRQRDPRDAARRERST